MRQTTKNVIAIIFVVLCALVLAALLTPPEMIEYFKKLLDYFFRL